MSAALVLAAHGSRDPAAAAALQGLVGAVEARRPGLAVLPAYVDIGRPSLAGALARLAGPAVVVPFLLSTGRHLCVDVGEVSARADVPVATALGPGRDLARLLADLLDREAVAADAPVVLAAAGTGDPRGRADVARQAGCLAELRAAPVLPAYAAAGPPSVAAAVAGLRTQGHADVAVASYLLAPGFFARRLQGAGATWCTPPLTAHPGLADVVLARYEAGRG